MLATGTQPHQVLLKRHSSTAQHAIPNSTFPLSLAGKQCPPPPPPRLLPAHKQPSPAAGTAPHFLAAAPGRAGTPGSCTVPGLSQEQATAGRTEAPRPAAPFLAVHHRVPLSASTSSTTCCAVLCTMPHLGQATAFPMMLVHPSPPAALAFFLPLPS